MSKKNVSKGNHRSVDTEVSTFKTISYGVLDGSGLASFPLIPGGFTTRSTAMADAFTLYRVLALKFRLLPPTAANAGYVGVGFYSDILDTPPATVADVMELEHSVLLPVTTKYHKETDWIKVPRRALSGALPWYKTSYGSQDPWEEVSGFLRACGSATDPYLVEIVITYEFKGPAAPANTPELDKRMVAARKAFAGALMLRQAKLTATGQ